MQNFPGAQNLLVEMPTTFGTLPSCITSFLDSRFLMLDSGRAQCRKVAWLWRSPTLVPESRHSNHVIYVTFPFKLHTCVFCGITLLCVWETQTWMITTFNGRPVSAPILARKFEIDLWQLLTSWNLETSWKTREIGNLVKAKRGRHGASRRWW